LINFSEDVLTPLFSCFSIFDWIPFFPNRFDEDMGFFVIQVLEILDI